MNVVFFNDDGSLNVERFEAFYQKNKDFTKYNNLEKQALHAYLALAKKKQIENPNFFEENPIAGNIVKLAIGSGIGAALFGGATAAMNTTISGFITGFLDKGSIAHTVLGKTSLEIKELIDNYIYKFLPPTTSLAKVGAYAALIIFGVILAVKGSFKLFKQWRRYCRDQKAQLEMENYNLAKRIPSYNNSPLERKITNVAVQKLNNNKQQ